MTTNRSAADALNSQSMRIEDLEPPKLDYREFFIPTPAPTPKPQATPSPVPARAWRVLERSGKASPAFATGDWGAVAAGRLKAEDFQPVSPPDLAAALGLATVYEPNSAGWFLAAGRRLHVKTTGPERGYSTYSYESLARIGWAVGVAEGTTPTARLSWERGPGRPLDFEDFMLRAVREAPGGSGAWIVAGQVEFARVQGYALRRSPADGVPMNEDSTPGDEDRFYFSPTTQMDVPALVVALVVDPTQGRDSPAARLVERFFSPDAVQAHSGLLDRAHYAPLVAPAPALDTSRPFQEIWNGSPGDKSFPRITTVRQVLSETSVARAHLSVWAIDTLVPYDLYRQPEFVDLLELDRTFLTEQMWATEHTFVGEPIYERPRFLLRKAPAEALVRINKRLGEQGLRLKIYDAYRPLSVTQRLYNLQPDKGRQGFLAAPNMGSRHNRGAAVDVTLTDMEGVELEMPSEYLCFDERSYRSWAGMTPEARANMEKLTRAMATEGFTTIHEEWWHYDAPNWSQYQVANIPFWPEDEEALGESPAVAERDATGQSSSTEPLYTANLPDLDALGPIYTPAPSPDSTEAQRPDARPSSATRPTAAGPAVPPTSESSLASSAQSAGSAIHSTAPSQPATPTQSVRAEASEQKSDASAFVPVAVTSRFRISPSLLLLVAGLAIALALVAWRFAG